MTPALTCDSSRLSSRSLAAYSIECSRPAGSREKCRSRWRGISAFANICPFRPLLVPIHTLNIPSVPRADNTHSSSWQGQNTLRVGRQDGQASAVISSQLDTAFPSLACLIPTCWRDSPPQEERTCGRLFRLPSETFARCKLLAPLRRRPTYLTKNGAFSAAALISASHMTAPAPSFILVLTTPFAACVVSALLMHGRRESPPLVFSLSARERWIVTVVVPCSMYVEVHTRCNILLS